MSIFSGLGARGRGLFSDNKGPGARRLAAAAMSRRGRRAAGPWGEPPKRARSAATGPRSLRSTNSSSKSRERFGGGGRAAASASAAAQRLAAHVGHCSASLALWLLFTTMHRIAPEERGVVTRFGRYSHTLSPGIGLTLPSPIDRVQKINVEDIRDEDIGSATEETLMLTGDQNMIDIAYSGALEHPRPRAISVRAGPARRDHSPGRRKRDAPGHLAGRPARRRWASRAAKSRHASGRNAADARRYRSGVVIQGVAIRQADPPAAVNEAFKEVTAAQQQAQTDVNNANAYALQLRQKRAGRGDGVRQGLRAVPAGARSDQAAACIMKRWSGSCETSTRRLSRRRA